MFTWIPQNHKCAQRAEYPLLWRDRFASLALWALSHDCERSLVSQVEPAWRGPWSACHPCSPSLAPLLPADLEAELCKWSCLPSSFWLGGLMSLAGTSQQLPIKASGLTLAGDKQQVLLRFSFPPWTKSLPPSIFSQHPLPKYCLPTETHETDTLSHLLSSTWTVLSPVRAAVADPATCSPGLTTVCATDGFYSSSPSPRIAVSRFPMPIQWGPAHYVTTGPGRNHPSPPVAQPSSLP